MDGIVTDIARFSLNDGPGIRTTVFLKGCPLHCVWCHNPETIKREPQVSFNQEKCVNCGACKEEPYLCPNGAKKVIGKPMTVDEILQEVIKDCAFYETSGGGLTISGGEPLYSPEFTYELLKKAKDEKINTAIETNGFADTKVMLSITELCDTVLFDFKETSNQRHIQYTGQGNDIILKNLELLCSFHSNVILRCPIIPGLNDREDHFKKITEISQKYSSIIRVELMPYHDIWFSKARQIGMKKLLDVKPPQEKDKQRWLDILKGYGCSAVIG